MTPRHRPLIPVLIGFALGIGLDGAFVPPFALWGALGCAALVVAVRATAGERKPWLRWLAAVLLLVPVGGAWHGLRYRQKPPWHLANLLTGETWRCRVRAVVAAGPQSCLPARAFAARGAEAGRLWICRVNVRALSPDGARWRRAKGRLTVFVAGARPEVLRGDEIEFLGRIGGNRPATNPGEPDLREVYARQGEHGVASVHSAAALEVRRRPPWYGSLPTALGRLRSFLKSRLIWNAEHPLHPLVGTLVFGERTRLSVEQKEIVAESGALHFLAVSGLHVGIFAAFVWAATAWLRVPIRPRLLLLIALVWFYALLTGLRVPAMRAALMLSLVCGAPLLGRRSDPLSGLLAAALIILVRSPQALFTAGFQYTFVAVWAIFYLYSNLAPILWPWDGLLLRLQHPSERSLWDDVRRYGQHYLLLSACIWIAVAPLTAYHFHRCVLLVPLTNLFVWPLMLVLILSSLCVAALAPMGGVLLAALLQVTGFLSRRIMDLLEAAASVRTLVLYTSGPPLWWIGLFYVVLVVWVMRAKLRRGRGVFLAGALVLCGSYIWADVAARRPDHLTVSVADVGHGQCVVFRCPSGGVMLYDAGSAALSRQNGPAGILWKGRVRRIGALVVSHRDVDHCSFVPVLARRFRVGELLMPPYVGGQDSAERGLASLGLRRTALAEGGRLKLDGLECEALHPSDRFLAAPGLSANERSVVLLCRAGLWKLLLTGDIQRLAMARLVADYGAGLEADVLLLPHHGTWEPGLREFVEQVRPKLALASCWGAADGRTRNMLDDLGVPFWTTAEHGAITMTLEDGGLVVSGFRSGQRVRLRPPVAAGLVPGSSGESLEEGL